MVWCLSQRGWTTSSMIRLATSSSFKVHAQGENSDLLSSSNHSTVFASLGLSRFNSPSIPRLTSSSLPLISAPLYPLVVHYWPHVGLDGYAHAPSALGGLPTLTAVIGTERLLAAQSWRIIPQPMSKSTASCEPPQCR